MICHVAGERVLLDVVEIVGHRFRVGQIRAAVDLGQAGDARLHIVALLPLRPVLRDQLGLVRPRPDEVHVAAQDVEQVRQLVQAAGPQRAADGRLLADGPEHEGVHVLDVRSTRSVFLRRCYSSSSGT